MSTIASVLVYGATGRTGRLICRELARQGVSFLVAGRDRAKLERLSEMFAPRPEVAVAALDDVAALVRACERARVVLACAGPFVRHGAAIQGAALAAGRHFLDLSGEPDFVRATLSRDEEARRRGVALINGVGFDVVPTDAAAAMAAQSVGSPVESVRIAYSGLDAAATPGIALTLLEGGRRGSLATVAGALVREPLGAALWRVPFPPRVGLRTAISVPWADTVTAARSTGARNVRAYLAVPRLVARVFPLLRPLLGALRWAPVHRWLSALLGALPRDRTAKPRSPRSLAAYAEARGPLGTRGVWVSNGSCEQLTAACAALCAQLASEPTFAAQGALTPVEAFGAQRLLDGIVRAGARWGYADGP
jgi:short subunit dehydrogenase-like uncharacterized protein